MTYLQVLDNLAPLKHKTVRANHAPYMSKALRKAIMKVSKLERKYLKNTTSEYKKVHSKQKELLQQAL